MSTTRPTQHTCDAADRALGDTTYCYACQATHGWRTHACSLEGRHLVGADFCDLDFDGTRRAEVCPTCAVTVPGLACFGCGTVQPGELAPEIAEGIARNRELYGEPCRDACGYDCLHLQGVDQCDFNKDGSRRAEVEVTGDQVRSSPVFAAFSPEAREFIARNADTGRHVHNGCGLDCTRTEN